MLTKLTWPSAAVIIAILASIVMLSWLRTDTQVITNLVVLLGLGGGLGVLAGIRANINGNLTQLIGTLERAMNQLAQSQPPTAPDNGDKSLS